MTVSSTSFQTTVSGNGATSVFTYAFLIPTGATVTLIYTSAAGVRTTLGASTFSLTGRDNATGGTFTYPLVGAPIAAATSLTLIRTSALTQSTSLPAQGPSTPTAVETALDLTMMALQEFSGAVVPFSTDHAMQILGYDARGAATLYPIASTSAVDRSNDLVTASGGSVPRSLAAMAADRVPLKAWGINTSNTAAANGANLQAALDANPTGNFDLPSSATAYQILGPIYLSDSTGRNFSGTFNAAGATINWTNAGSAGDTEINMQKGFVARPKTLTIYSDTTGIRQAQFNGGTYVGPTHGAAIYLANSQGCGFNSVVTQTNRYGIVMECCIKMAFWDCLFQEYTNAGIGMLMLSDTTKVYYGVSASNVPNGSPTFSYWNDSPKFDSCGFVTSVVGGIGHIVDHGSQAENIRIVLGCYFYSANNGCGPYGIVSRSGNWAILCSWSERVNSFVRILSSNAAEGGSGTALPWVTAAEPGGTYTLANFPDGISAYFSASQCFTSGCIIDYNVSGAQGNVTLGPNESTYGYGYYVQSLFSSTSTIIDLGTTVYPVVFATTGASGTGATATISFPALPLAPVVGSTVVIAGVTPAGYNGTFTITASTTTSVSYANVTAGAQTVAGTISYTNPYKNVSNAIYMAVSDLKEWANPAIWNNAVNDAAAAGAGTALKKPYRNGSVVMIRWA